MIPVKTEVALSKKTWLLSMKSAKGAEDYAIERCWENRINTVYLSAYH